MTPSAPPSRKLSPVELLLGGVLLLVLVLFLLRDRQEKPSPPQQASLEDAPSARGETDGRRSPSDNRHSSFADSFRQGGWSGGDGEPELPATALRFRGSFRNTAEPLPPEQLLERVRGILAAERRDRAQFEALLGHLTPEDFALIAPMMNLAAWDLELKAMVMKMVSEWGAADPTAALEFASEFNSKRIRQEAQRRALLGWTYADPQAALAWYLENQEDDPRTRLMNPRELMLSLYDVDPETAKEQIWTLPHPGTRVAALRAIMERVDPATRQRELLGMFKDSADPEVRTTVAQVLVGDWARNNPDATARWVDAIDDPDIRQAAEERMISAWRRDMPQRAADRISQMDDPQARSQQAQRLLKEWIPDNPVDSANWLQSLPADDPTLDPARNTMVKQAFRADPEIATAWAATLVQDKQRQQSLRYTLGAWAKQDRAAARDYLENSDLPDRDRRALAPIVSRQKHPAKRN